MQTTFFFVFVIVEPAHQDLSQKHFRRDLINMEKSVLCLPVEAHVPPFVAQRMFYCTSLLPFCMALHGP